MVASITRLASCLLASALLAWVWAAAPAKWARSGPVRQPNPTELPSIFRVETPSQAAEDAKLSPMEALKRLQQQPGAFCPICKKGHPGAFVHGPETN